MDNLWYYTSSHFNWFFWGRDTQVTVIKRIVPLVTMFEVHWATDSASCSQKKILQIHVHESSEGKVPHPAVPP